MKVNNKIHIIRILVYREIKSTLHGFGFYLVLSISLFISTLVMKEYIQIILLDGILVSRDLLNYPLYLSVLIGSLYLALTSTITITKEKEEGTLQTLFFSPIDEVSYVLGKYFQQIFCYIAFVSVSIIYIVLSSKIINISISPNSIKLIFLLIITGSCIISFGLLISSLAKSIKNSVMIFIGFMTFFIGIEATTIYFSVIKLQEANMAILYIRNVLEVISSITRLVSPFSLLNAGFEAVRIGNSVTYNQNLFFSIAYSILLIMLAILVFKHRGVTNK